MSAKVICPDCGFSNEPSERFCILCDARLANAARAPSSADGGQGGRAARAPAPDESPAGGSTPPRPVKRGGSDIDSATPRGTAVNAIDPAEARGAPRKGDRGPADRGPAGASAPAGAPGRGGVGGAALPPAPGGGEAARSARADGARAEGRSAGSGGAKRPAPPPPSAPAKAAPAARPTSEREPPSARTGAPGDRIGAAAGPPSPRAGTSRSGVVEPPSQRTGSPSGSSAVEPPSQRTGSPSGSSATPPRPAQGSVARPEDFPNSILRKVAAGQQVAEASKDAFTRKRRAGSGVALAIELDRAYRVGAPEVVRLRLENLEPMGLDVEVHLEIGEVEQERSVVSLRLEDGAPCLVELAFRATVPGRKPLRRLEVALVEPTGDIRLFALKAGEAPVLAVGDPGAERPTRWQPLDLEPIDRDRLAESLQTVLAAARCLERPKSLVGAARLRPAPPLLVAQVGGDARRIFIHMADETVYFGRKKPAREGTANHIVLRLLPCRSAEEDPQHWNQTMAISGTHGAFLLKEGGLAIQNMSRHGIILNGKKMHPDEHTKVADVFVLMLAGVLRLKGRVYAPTRDASLLTFTAPPTGLPRGDGFDAAEAGPVDCYHLRRVANREEDEYLFVYRNAGIGASPVCPLRVAGEGVAPLHARLLRHRTCWLVTPERGVEGALRVDGHPLKRDEVAPIGPGTELRLGETSIRFAEASSADQIAVP